MIISFDTKFVLNTETRFDYREKENEQITVRLLNIAFNSHN
jgi:hypothetical protein